MDQNKPHISINSRGAIRISEFLMNRLNLANTRIGVMFSPPEEDNVIAFQIQPDTSSGNLYHIESCGTVTGIGGLVIAHFPKSKGFIYKTTWYPTSKVLVAHLSNPIDYSGATQVRVRA